MSLPALATITDVENRMTRALTPAEAAAVPFFLLDASTEIRNWTRQDFTLSQTTEKLRPVDSFIELPQRPVVSVDALARVNPLGTGTIPYSLWTWNQVDKIYVGPIQEIVNAPQIFADMSWIYRSVMYEVTYTHGYDTPDMPDDVVGVTADMVRRVILGPQPGVVGETIGGYSYRMVDGYQPGLVTMLPIDRARLRKYRAIQNRTVELGG